MADFVEVARLDQIQPGTGSRVQGRWQGRGRFQCGRQSLRHCRHVSSRRGRAGNGKLHGKIVICPVHGMKFDITTGCFAGTSDFGVAPYPVNVVDGKILVAVS